MNANPSQVVLQSPSARTLRSRLELAVASYYNQIPIYAPIPRHDPLFEIKFEDRLALAKARRNNDALYQYYFLGERLLDNPDVINDDFSTHRIAVFLFRYFEGIPSAIFHLNDVSPYNIKRVSSNDRRNIIDIKPHPTPSSQDSPQYEPQEICWSDEENVLSPDVRVSSPSPGLGADDLWRDNEDSLIDHARELNTNSSDEFRRDPTITRDFTPGLLSTSCLTQISRHSVPAASRRSATRRFSPLFLTERQGKRRRTEIGSTSF
jgi:hypothetical protein